MLKKNNSKEIIEVFNTFLCQFEETVSQFEHKKRLQRNEDAKIIHSFLEGFTQTLSKAIEDDRKIAKNLNVFDVIGFQRDEIRHSMVLAWLLDRWGTHSQGTLFFEGFLKTCSLPEWFVKRDYSVSRELSGEESRVDIEILGKEFLIQIENKVGSVEGEDQTAREFRDIVKRAKTLKIPPQNTYQVFLTPSGDEPSYKVEEKYLGEGFHSWKAVSYYDLATALEHVLDDIGAPSVRMFVDQYIDIITKFVLQIEEVI